MQTVDGCSSTHNGKSYHQQARERSIRQVYEGIMFYMNYQITMKCYDCQRSGSNIRAIPVKHTYSVIGCKVCNNKMRVPLPTKRYESTIEKDAHIFVVCYMRG